MCSEQQDHGHIANFATSPGGVSDGLVVNVVIGKPEEDEPNKIISVAISTHGLMFVLIKKEDPDTATTARLDWADLAELIENSPDVEEDDEPSLSNVRIPEFNTLEDLMKDL